MKADVRKEGATKKRVRKSPEARQAEIVASARKVFSARQYPDVGMVDVASEANVSSALLYHYFPDGRPQLFETVHHSVLDDLLEQLRLAANVPFSARTRLDHAFAAMFGYFTANPDAHRLLFRDPWIAREETLESACLAGRARIASELSALMAGPDTAPDDLVAKGAGALAFALANIELCLTGQLEPEVAWRVTCEHCASGLPRESTNQPT